LVASAGQDDHAIGAIGADLAEAMAQFGMDRLAPDQWPAIGVEAQQNDRDWNNFRAVASEDTRIINSWGQVSHSLGQRDYLFNRAEGRLTAFHAEIERRTRPGGVTAS
jgi:predicted DNA-binding WGR domain protein